MGASKTSSRADAVGPGRSKAKPRIRWLTRLPVFGRWRIPDAGHGTESDAFQTSLPTRR